MLPTSKATPSLLGRRLAVFGILVLSAVLVYAPALQGDILWDDYYLIRENPFFKSPVFLLEVFRHWLFLDSFSVYYRPVQNWSYMADYWIWNANPFGYHFTNVLLHAFSGYLLYRLLMRLLPALLPASGASRQREAVAFFVAWIWVIHPIHNAAVAYISGRADSLAALFSLLAWLAYLRGRAASSRPARAGFFAAAPVCALLALCSKEIALVWLGLFALSLVFEAVLSRPRPAPWALAAPLLGVGAVVLAYYALRHLPAPRTPIAEASGDSFAARVLLMLRALGDYTGLMFFPSGLRMERIVFSPEAYGSLPAWQKNIRYEYLSLLGSATLFCFAFFSCQALPGRRLRLFGALWFLIGFLPISNLFPLNAQVAEHWIYIPSIGFLLFVAGCVAALPPRGQAIAAGIAAVACVGLGIRTGFRSAEWANPELFYSRMIAEGSGSPRIYTNLGFVYSQRKDYGRAVSVLREGVRRYPAFTPARINLGINLAEEGRAEEAKKYLTFEKPEADSNAAHYPRTWSAAVALAHLRNGEKKPEDALAVLDEAISRNREIWDLVREKARILQHASRLPEATALVAGFAREHWWHYEAAMVLGRLLLEQGETAPALVSLRHAALLDIHGSEPFKLIAQVELRRRNPAEAYDAEMRAIGRDPDQPTQFTMLSAILEQLGRKPEADAALRRAEDLRRLALAAPDESPDKAAPFSGGLPLGRQ